MKAIMVMFDTLRRTMMPCFQPEDQKVPMPNFQRLIRQGGSCIRAEQISCTGAGGRWNHLMIPCRSCLRRPGYIHICRRITTITLQMVAPPIIPAIRPGRDSEDRWEMPGWENAGQMSPDLHL